MVQSGATQSSVGKIESDTSVRLWPSQPAESPYSVLEISRSVCATRIDTLPAPREPKVQPGFMSSAVQPGRTTGGFVLVPYPVHTR